MKLKVYNTSTDRSRVLDQDLEFTNITSNHLEFTNGDRVYKLVFDDKSDRDFFVKEMLDVGE